MAAETALSAPNRHSWWGPWTIPEGGTLRWRIGPMTIWIHRTRHELRMGHKSSIDPLDSALEVATPVAAEDLDDAVVPERFALFDAADALVLWPAPADRAVITRPQSPFHILPGKEVKLYVSSPLWARIALEPSHQVLREFPIYRPADTWFGPSTTTGELCYASRTHCRLDLEDVPFRPHRAVTPLLIRNLYDTPLLLERVSVPVPHLSLFSGFGGHLWTEAVQITRKDTVNGLAQVDIKTGPPEQVSEAQLITAPRRELKENLLVRTFGGLL
jgi:hypothetical protein